MCLKHFMAQIWQQPPDAVVSRSWHQRESNIEVSIRPTKLSANHDLLYKEVELAMTTLLEHIEEEDIYYQMEFNFYETVPLEGTIWKMEGTSFSGLLLTLLEGRNDALNELPESGNADPELLLQECFFKCIIRVLTLRDDGS